MESLVHVAHSVSPLAAGLLIASVWQGLLLTAVVALVLRLVRGVSPATRSWVWTAVLALFLLLPMLGLLLPHHAAPSHAELHVAEGWSVALLAVWSLVAAFRAVQLFANAVRLSRLARRAVPVQVEPEIATMLAASRHAELCGSPEVNRPSVTGFFRPRVLLPEGLLETLSPAELAHVVLHECEHLRRRDDWLNLLQQVSLVLLPLNPALVWLDRRLCRERELACDDGVLAATGANKAYAACLVKLAEDSLVRKGLTLALSALGTRARESELVARVRRILSGPERAANSRWARFAVAGLTVAVLGSAGLLVRSPELVSFDGAPAVMAQASVPVSGRTAVETGTTAGPLPTSAGLGHPVLAKAVVALQGTRPSMTLAVRRMPRVSSGSGVLTRTLAGRAAALRAKPWITVPAPYDRQAAGSRLTVPIRKVADEDFARPTATPAAAAGYTVAPRVVVTEFEVSQPMFAAVPVRGGWLILQL